jgi:hypothetical protein
VIASGNTGLLNPKIKMKLFELNNNWGQFINLQRVNNEDIVWHIKQYESALDYSYPKLKNTRFENTPIINNTELLKKYTNVLAKKYEKSVDHVVGYKDLLNESLIMITMIEKQISKDY